MFESMELSILQHYWWFIVSLLGAILVFLLFVQGGQTFLLHLPENEEEKTMIINSLGRKWELTFTTLVTFGGAMFAAFPKFYATSFGGAYWLWMTILFCFIIQAVSYEFRIKKGNFLGKKTYETFLFINGTLGTFLLGVAVSTFYNGSYFSVNDLNFSKWQSSFRGFEAVFNIHNISLGFTILFLAKVLGLLYLINNIEDNELRKKMHKKLLFNSIVFVAFFLFFIVKLFMMKGFAVDPQSKLVYFEDYKYFKNLIEMPIVLIIFLVGVILVLTGIVTTILKNSTKGIWFSGIGTIFTVLALLLIAGWNNTSFYPSLFDINSSLTIENSSSSKFTLTVMSYVSLLVPFVVAYIYHAWKAIDSEKISISNIKKEENTY